MNLYAESSAILAWLLGEKSALDVRPLLAKAEATVTSDLTLVECDRVLIRAVTLGELTEVEAADRKALLEAASAHWHVLRLSPEVVDRARQPFAGEPIRTLDALHLATALIARTAIAGLKMLTLDDRIRKAAVKLGLGVLPEGSLLGALQAHHRADGTGPGTQPESAP